eukprot:3705983-Pyramimonas_sp.AAC.1
MFSFQPSALRSNLNSITPRLAFSSSALRSILNFKHALRAFINQTLCALVWVMFRALSAPACAAPAHQRPAPSSRAQPASLRA